MLTIIAAVAINNALGKNNDLIWSLPADLKRFKKVTLGHHVIMGRKTFESLGKPLPNRTTIIISRKPDYKVSGCITVNSLEEAINAATINGAYAMGISNMYGSITRGKKANLIITKPLNHYSEIPYAFAHNHIDTVIINGQLL